jgi:hypothetical protein
MNKLTYLSTFLFLMVACQTNSSVAHGTTTNSLPDITQTFKSIINGDWYQASYIESIKETKSPFRSKNSLFEYVELNINTNKTTGDSLAIGAPSIHEGSSFIVYFKPGLTNTSFPTNIVDENRSSYFELGYSISRNDTSLIIFHYNKEKKLIGQVKYLRASKNSEGALQFMVNKTLFAGDYNAEDSSGKTSVLKFTNDGHLIGISEVEKYYILTDFVVEPENSVDEVFFDIQTSKQKCYAFVIEGDTTKLYDVQESAGQDTLTRGQLKYKLVRQ